MGTDDIEPEKKTRRKVADLADQRRRSAKAIADMKIEDLPDPEELSRQLRHMHGFDLPSAR